MDLGTLANTLRRIILYVTSKERSHKQWFLNSRGVDKEMKKTKIYVILWVQFNLKGIFEGRSAIL